VGIKQGQLYWHLLDGKIHDLVVTVKQSANDTCVWYVMTSKGDVIRAVSWSLIPMG
jgi:hypothetical protein